MVKDAKSTGPRNVDNGQKDLELQLRDELRRWGMTEAEIEAAVRKRKRRKPLEFNAVVYPERGLLPVTNDAPQVKPKASTSKPDHRRAGSPMSEELCTVDFAADRLKLHPKTVLRFIRGGRLRATRVGKSYRILRADLEAFAGVPARAEAAVDAASVTCIVDMPGVGADVAAKWAATITNALAAKPKDGAAMRAEVIYEPQRSHLKIVIIGTPNHVVNLLSLIGIWLEQLRA
jgi:excisionase family DNA binding protein